MCLALTFRPKTKQLVLKTNWDDGAVYLLLKVQHITEVHRASGPIYHVGCAFERTAAEVCQLLGIEAVPPVKRAKRIVSLVGWLRR